MTDSTLSDRERERRDLIQINDFFFFQVAFDQHGQCGGI